MEFETEYLQILKKLENIEVKNYQKTRNYLDGEVSFLSPYITHGVLPLKFVADFVIRKFGLKGPGNAEHFIFQLGWHEYFQKIWLDIGDKVLSPVKNPQKSVESLLIGKNLLEAKTGINVIDDSILNLYKNGYMHNHARMWTASIICNLHKTGFKAPADWLFYHLLDGDIASNYLSWQWVAGTFSSKKYLCNQENLNKYSKCKQFNTPIDKSYEEIAEMVDDPNYCLDLGQRVELELPVYIPDLPKPNLDLTGLKVSLFSIWTLDPNFAVDDESQKILLIEPGFLTKFKMSEKRINFILNLAKNIPGIEILVMDYDQFDLEFALKCTQVSAKFHPACSHWTNVDFTEADYIFPDINPPFRSYFDFWNKAKKYLEKEYAKTK